MLDATEFSLEESIENCELELFETNRRIAKVNKIIDIINQKKGQK